MGTSCLLMARVSGYRRVPDPPARMIPLRMSLAETIHHKAHQEHKAPPRCPASFVAFVFFVVNRRLSRHAVDRTEPLAPLPAALHRLAPAAGAPRPSHRRTDAGRQ